MNGDNGNKPTSEAAIHIPPELPVPDIESEREMHQRLLEKRAEKTNIIMHAQTVFGKILHYVSRFNTLRKGIVDQIVCDDKRRTEELSGVKHELTQIDDRIKVVQSEADDLRKEFHESVGKAGLECTEETPAAVRKAACCSFGAGDEPEASQTKEGQPQRHNSPWWEHLLAIAPGFVVAISAGTIMGLIGPSDLTDPARLMGPRTLVLALLGTLVTIYIGRSIRETTREMVRASMPVDPSSGRKGPNNTPSIVFSCILAVAELSIDAFGFYQLYILRAARMARMNHGQVQDLPFILFMLVGTVFAFGYFAYIHATEKRRTADEQRLAIEDFETLRKYEQALAEYRRKTEAADQYLRNNPSAQTALALAGRLRPMIKELSELKELRDELAGRVRQLEVPCRPSAALIGQLQPIKTDYERVYNEYNATLAGLNDDNKVII